MRHARALSWGALALLVVASGVVTPFVGTVASATTHVRSCVARQISVSVGPSNGAAGTIFFPITFHNKSNAACRMVGIPVVQPAIGTNYVSVGPAARRDVIAGRGGSVTLAKHTGQVTVAYGVAETGNYPAARCGATRFDELKINFYSGPSFSVNFGHDSTCTKVASTQVSGIVGSASTQVPLCVARQISVSVGLGDGAAGTIYFPITFHNKSNVACRMVGIPVVQPAIGTNYVSVGPAARRDLLAGRGGSVTLAKQTGKVTVAYGVAETGNYPAALCGATPFDELKINFYSGPSFSVNFGHDTTCTKVASTHVTGIIAGTAG